MRRDVLTLKCDGTPVFTAIQSLQRGRNPTIQYTRMLHTLCQVAAELYNTDIKPDYDEGYFENAGEHLFYYRYCTLYDGRVLTIEP